MLRIPPFLHSSVIWESAPTCETSASVFYTPVGFKFFVFIGAPADLAGAGLGLRSPVSAKMPRRTTLGMGRHADDYLAGGQSGIVRQPDLLGNNRRPHGLVRGRG